MRRFADVRPLARAASLSLLVLVPVYWQPRVISSDLSSHTYNAWIALQVERDGIPGLVVVRQYTNVLFDLVLSLLLRHFDAATTERIAVSGAVLVFFWGAWWLVRAVRRTVDPGSVAVLLAVTHGWVLQQGLFNYYLAVACSLWFLGCSWRRGMRGFLRGAPFLVVATLGNPLPALWAVSVAAFVGFAHRLPGTRTWVAFFTAAVGVRVLLSLPGWPLDFWWRSDQALYATGADQLVVFSAWSVVPAGVLLTHWLHHAAGEIRRTGMAALAARPEFQALVASVACVVLLPAGFRIPDHDSLVSLIPQRQSLGVIVLAVATFGPWGLRAVRYTAFTITLAYFGLLFAGHVRVTDVERQVKRQLALLPAGGRVIGGAQYRNTRVAYYQLAERACLGRCWSYANYEASSGLFRLRTTGPNPVVISDVGSIRDVHLGRYVVRSGDLPAWMLENCPSGANRYCLRAVASGDTVGSAAR